MAETQRSRDLARAALLRERIIGALKAAAHPMTMADLAGMSGIVELYHQRLLLEKVERQVRALQKTGVVKKTGRVPGRGGPVLWEFDRDRRDAMQAAKDAQQATAATSAGKLQELQIEVNKADGSIAFTLSGVRITVKVL